MNKKSSIRAPHNEFVQTTYPTRRPVGSKDVGNINDRCANWEGAPVASTRIFHPFEYWVPEMTDVEDGFADGPADSRTIKDGRLKQPMVALGWLRDWAMGLFRQVHGP